MYEFGIMAYDVAVIRCIVVAIERNMSCPWLKEKTQILKKSQNILCPRLNIVSLQPKEFFEWLCKSRQDATFCIFLIRNLFFL